MAPPTPTATAFTELEAYSRSLSEASANYWQRHLPRFQYLAELVGQLQAGREPFRRVLDVGMGFQTSLLERLLPDARIDCLGHDPDHRFLPKQEYTFHRLDLNEITPASASSIADRYDLIVFMEVVEHLLLPPETVLACLGALLAPGGLLLLTTPNAAWIRNRWQLLFGRNPFEPLRADKSELGHIREYTLAEIDAAFLAVPLTRVRLERRGLYRFRQAKDNLLSALTERFAPPLARTIVAVYRRDPAGGAAAHP